MRAAAVMVLVSALLAPSFARADASEADTLFNQGRELLERGQLADACAKFKKSNELAPSASTLLNLGYCQEQLGRLKTAMDAYTSAQALAEKAGDTKKIAFAKERYAAAQQRVAKLVILVAPPIAPDLEVQRNGVTVAKSDLGQSLPVDSDEIVVTATAPGRRPWRTVVIARGEGASFTVFVPPLEEIASVTQRQGLDSRRVVALGLGAIGVGTLGAGIALALGARSRYRDTLDQCDASGCDPRALDIQSSARSQGNVATVLIGLGAVTVGASVFLWLTSGKPEDAAHAKVAFGPGGVRGVF